MQNQSRIVLFFNFYYIVYDILKVDTQKYFNQIKL